MTRDNAYKIFNLTSSATTEDVNKRYKTLVKKHHPDKGGNAENFKLIVEAKNVLLKKPEFKLNSLKEHIDKLKEQLEKQEREYLYWEAIREKKRVKNRRVFKFRVILMIIYMIKCFFTGFFQMSGPINISISIAAYVFLFVKAEYFLDKYDQFKNKRR